MVNIVVSGELDIVCSIPLDWVLLLFALISAVHSLVYCLQFFLFIWLFCFYLLYCATTAVLLHVAQYHSSSFFEDIVQ